MSILQIILIILILPLTFMNIHYFTVGRKEKALAYKKKQDVINSLNSNKKLLDKYGTYTVSEYMSDIGDNYFLCKSKSSDIGAIVTESSFYVLNPLSSFSCDVKVIEEKRKYKSIICEILSGSEIKFVIPISVNSHYKKWLGKNLLAIALEIKDEINAVSVRS